MQAGLKNRGTMYYYYYVHQSHPSVTLSSFYLASANVEGKLVLTTGNDTFRGFLDSRRHFFLN